TGALGYLMLPSAAAWAREAPGELRQLAPKLRELAKPVREANQAAESFARAAGGQTGRQPQLVRTEADPWRHLVTTPRLLASLLAGRQQQKFTVEILQSIEREVSRYVLTISVINGVVGLSFAFALYLMQIPLPEALMWGTMVALLNFAPYVGPLLGVLAMLLV